MSDPSSMAFTGRERSEIDRVLLETLADECGAGETFFQTFAAQVSRALDMAHVVVAEFDTTKSVRALASLGLPALPPGATWELSGGPAARVASNEPFEQLAGVSASFPGDALCRSLRAESFAGVPLLGFSREPIGALCVFDPRRMTAEPRRLLALRAFAARAAAELLRLRLETTLRKSEQVYRDLYEEAPIAYVHEDLQSRFISANRAAMRILGIKPEEVPGFVGASLAPETPDAQRRLQEAFASVGRGTDTSGVVLELTRKDDGRPVWIQWWSRPEANGRFTRTMFVDITDRVLMEREQVRLRAQNVYLQEEIKSLHNFEEIIGQSPPLLKVLELVARVAQKDSTVLITGETGTGKELVARAIHSKSHRSGKPLIKLNCAGLPSGLVESELFGHERGAFSGAIQRRIGRFELAHGGTIFLDEIGEMPREAQVKLLRVLQEREFERLGGTETIRVDVRVIAATNRELSKAVQAGEFREDLFYRLNVFPVSLPPLRERADDIPLLIRFFVNKYGIRVDRRIEEIEPETLSRLVSYEWPGNIRELQNLIERALILSSGPELRIDPETFRRPDAPHAPLGADLQRIERGRVLEALDKAGWVIEGEGGAAKQLGLHPNTLRSRMKRLGLKRAAPERNGLR